MIPRLRGPGAAARAGPRRDYGERRIKAIGRAAGQVLVCVYTDRSTARRIISLRVANRRERDAYRAAYKG
ncbi:MAG TPA: BrnT family toxin [Xanthobacteraceae bacterium]